MRQAPPAGLPVSAAWIVAAANASSDSRSAPADGSRPALRSFITEDEDADEADEADDTPRSGKEWLVDSPWQG